jgi:hypothetical protein
MVSKLYAERHPQRTPNLTSLYYQGVRAAADPRRTWDTARCVLDTALRKLGEDASGGHDKNITTLRTIRDLRDEIEKRKKAGQGMDEVGTLQSQLDALICGRIRTRLRSMQQRGEIHGA